MAKIASENLQALLVNGDCGAECLALLQGYPFSGFAKVSSGQLELAPAHRRLAPGAIPWNLFWDVRVFGEIGERHVWKLSDGCWRERFAKRLENSNDYLRREYPVWGSPTGDVEDGWTLLREDRGAEVWIPSEYATQARVVLEIDQILDVTSESSGVVSVADAMIRRLNPSAVAEDL